jgi:hypothetical protein
MNTSRSILAALLTGGALLTATTAFAQVDNGMIHGPVPEQAYAQPHMVQAAVVINLGWHGDRYWDGHRYWQRDEWMRHHPHDHGPSGYHHDDHGHDHDHG